MTADDLHAMALHAAQFWPARGITADDWAHVLEGKDLDVCRDVPAPSYLVGRRYPEVLDRLVNVELCELARRFGHAIGDDVGASDAATWESFEERMGYIFAFFRAFARDPRFFEVPDSFLSPATPRRSLTRTDDRGGGESQDAGSRSQR